MKREYYQQHSEALGQDMSMIVYGEGGYPVVVFQTQDSKSNNYEDFGMIDTLADFIDGGRIQVFSVDSVDEQSWSLTDGDKVARAQRQEDFFRFVTDELVPRVHAWNNSGLRPLATGCSMGATHAALAALRRPDLFQGCIALSGVYRTSYFFGDWMNGDLYQNDIPAFLSNMTPDHPYVELYNHRSLVLCVGQGAWEEGLDDLRTIDAELTRLGANHWCDFWGFDVNHDWPWWKKQIRYFLPIVLEDVEREVAAEKAAAQAESAGEAEAGDKPAGGAGDKTEPKKDAVRKPAVKRAPKASKAKGAARAGAPTKAAATSAKASAKAATPAKAKSTRKPASPAEAPTKAAATPAKAASAATPAAPAKTASKAGSTAGSGKATASKPATRKKAAKKTTKAPANKAQGSTKGGTKK